MKLLDYLRKKNKYIPSGIPSIESWRLFMSKKQIVDVSLRRGSFGGPYNPPSIKNSVEAEVFVEWSDGQCSHAILNRSFLNEPLDTMKTLYSQAYIEPYPDAVPGHFDLPDIRVCTPEVRDAVIQDPSPLLPTISNINYHLKDISSHLIHGMLNAEHKEVTFLTSNGADSFHDSTKVSYSLSLGLQSGFYNELRIIPNEEEVSKRVLRARREYEILNTSYTDSTNSIYSTDKVLLSASVVNQFINTYLIKNLSMQSILNGTSAFSIKDIHENNSIFHDSFSIIDTSLRDDHPTAYKLDARGQPAQERVIVENGYLRSADISLRAATQGKYSPTPIMLAGNLLFKSHLHQTANKNSYNLDSFIEKFTDGLYIYQVLGLHTQDTIKGQYSLGVPKAIIIKDGKIKGCVRGTLVGNFFHNLKQPLEIIEDPLSHMPMMVMNAKFISN